VGKKYLKCNVYEATQERLAYIFSEFENVLVAFSGGKDSGVCLNLCYDYAKKNELLDKLSMYHLDYEAQYQMTTDYVEEVFKSFEGIKKYWLCLPVGADCGCRMDSDTWTVWEKSKKDLWVRDMPQYECVINQNNCPFEMFEGQKDYEVQNNFCLWFKEHKGGGSTAVITGIRASESYTRYMRAKTDIRKYKDKKYILEQVNGVYHAFPIYDWETSDVWVYNAKFEKPYNRLYDLYYQAGLSIDQMRVANPFHSCGTDTLKLYKVIDPNNWGKMVGRVNGVCFAGIYGGTTAMGWKRITKPKHFTWKEYCYFLLNTLDPDLKQHYLDKLNVSIRFWKEKGGCLEDETIKELEEENVDFVNKGKTNKYSDKDVCTFDDYLDDTSCTNFKEVPTYKRMCICIIKNDYYCKYMGFAQTKNEITKRRSAIEKYRRIL
jgi:predicted phosphoadenosine phosphosulfate sulfurtransferase